MRVLFVTPYVPNRIRIRSYEFIRGLCQAGQDVTLVTQWSNERERAELASLRDECRQIVAVHLPRWRSLMNAALALPANYPLQAVYSWNPELIRQLKTISQPTDHRPLFDVVHVEHLRGVRYAQFLKTNRSLPVVWDSVDCISLLFRQGATSNPGWVGRMINRLELPRTESLERQVVHQFDRVLVTSPRDRQALLDLQPQQAAIPQIEVITNGVDLDYFHPSSENRKADTLVISGKMSYHANIHMCLHLVNKIMPYVWAKRKDIKVWIVGKDPPEMVRNLSRDGRITVTGEVEDMRPYLQTAGVAVVPMQYGTGIQNKILEAMACATPVVASPIAISSLQTQPGKEIMVATSPEEMAASLLELINGPDKAARIGQAGRIYVEKHHQWKGIVNQLQTIYTQLMVEKGLDNL